MSLQATEIDPLVSHAERIRKSGVLGKSQQLNRLFDLLVERSLQGTAPKEIEIAQIVFGKNTDTDLASDATVRVHVHRLRKKLDELPPDENGERVLLPRGQYRLVVTPAHADEPALLDEPAGDMPACLPPPQRPGVRGAWFAIVAAFLLLNLCCWLWLTRDPTPETRLGTAFWQALARSPNPALIVLGDQYVFGELDLPTRVAREIADPDVRTREDLDHYKKTLPDTQDRYIDLNAYHLPEGLAPALAAVTPIVLAAHQGKAGTLRSLTMSKFTNNMLRDNDIVYIGLLRNLGDLQEPLMDISGLSLSSEDDTLEDAASGRRFQSDWADPSTKGIMRRDYAYLASLPGPSANRVLVIAGTRDPALMEAIKIASDLTELQRLDDQVGNGRAFEALYEVRTFGPSNVSGTLLLARVLDVDQTWPASTRQPAP